MKNALVIFLLFFASVKNANAQKYYDLGSYKNSFNVERTLNTFYFGYGRNLASFNKHQSASMGYEYFIQNKLGISVSGYQYFKANKIIPDVSLGLVLMF
jgi:hypothetical protein